MKNKGFTLVELLAVIAILAILVIIALPNVLSMFNSAKKDVFLTEAKNIYKEVSKKYITETMKGNKVSNISNNKNKLDLESNNLKYNIKLNNDGSIKKFEVSNGTYCISGKFNNLSELTIDKITEGECKPNGNNPKAIYCTLPDVSTGENIEPGKIYINGDFMYVYKKIATLPADSKSLKWRDITADGWSMVLKESKTIETITSTPCTYINDKPIISMSYAYSMSNKLSSIDLRNINTSNVIYMKGMFSMTNASNIIGLEQLDTSKVIDMSEMFEHAENIVSLDLSNFDTSKVIDMSRMFHYMINLKDLDLSSFDTSNVISMRNMFHCTESLTSLDVSNFNTSKVTNMSDMFSYSQVPSLDLNNFDTSNVTNMSYMFRWSKLKSLDLSSFDTSKVTNMASMFENMSNLKEINISKFNTSNVTSMDRMFTVSNIEVLDLSSFDTSNVTNMSYMFENSPHLKTIYVSDKFSVNNVIMDYNMFKGCLKLVGNSGTNYNSNNINKNYARIDKGTSAPGYFSIK